MNLSRHYILVVLERFEEFRQDYSPKPRTARKQRARFERYCRRNFSSPHNIVTNPDLMDVEYKLHAAKQHQYLFLKSQGFNKPITHLKYKKKKDFAYTDDYKYKIPITSFSRTNPVSDAICETPSTFLRLSKLKLTINLHQQTLHQSLLAKLQIIIPPMENKGSKEWYAELTRRKSANINKVQQTNSLGTSVKKLDQERINVSPSTDSDKLKELNSQYEEFQLAHPILFNTKDAQNNDASTSLGKHFKKQKMDISNEVPSDPFSGSTVGTNLN
ncbi:unnamed protein product [Rhizophagus irregularis]|nr:unnamed protein product [Rhizophagus irregularis]